MDRRVAIGFGILYAVILALLAILNSWGAFLVVAVVGGPVLSTLYWMSVKGSKLDS